VRVEVFRRGATPRSVLVGGMMGVVLREVVLPRYYWSLRLKVRTSKKATIRSGVPGCVSRRSATLKSELTNPRATLENAVPSAVDPAPRPTFLSHVAPCPAAAFASLWVLNRCVPNFCDHSASRESLSRLQSIGLRFHWTTPFRRQSEAGRINNHATPADDLQQASYGLGTLPWRKYCEMTVVNRGWLQQILGSIRSLQPEQIPLTSALCHLEQRPRNHISQ
jgi:hypothetical protein